MSAFTYSDGIDQTALDYAILSRGPVGLYRSADGLRAAADTLAGLGYEAVTLDAAGWRGDTELFDAFVKALSFPEYFGHNWDAFEEVISDIGSGGLSWPRDATGLLVIIEHGDALASVSRRAARLLVQIFADASRRASLVGGRLIFLLQVSEETGTSIATTVTRPAARWQ